MIVANPMQVKAIAHAHVKTDKIDVVQRHRYGLPTLPEIWLPMPTPNAYGVKSRGGTKWSGIAHGSRMRCTPSCMLI